MKVALRVHFVQKKLASSICGEDLERGLLPTSCVSLYGHTEFAIDVSLAAREYRHYWRFCDPRRCLEKYAPPPLVYIGCLIRSMVCPEISVL